MEHQAKKIHPLDTPEGVQWRVFHFDLARLQSTTKTSIFLAAFGMGIFTSYQFTSLTNAPSWLVTLLSVNSVVLISLHSFAFFIGICLLPRMEAVEEEYLPPGQGQLRMRPVPKFSPHLRFSGATRMCHRCAHVFGLFVFLLEVPLVTWVKFYGIYDSAAIACTVCILPFMVAFVLFCWYFNYEYTTHAYQTRQNKLKEVQNMYSSIDATSVCDNSADQRGASLPVEGESNREGSLKSLSLEGE